MITYTIKILEVSGKGVMVDAVPEQSSASEAEMRYAGVIDYVMSPVFKAIASSSGDGEMIESKDAEAVKKLIEEKMKQFFAA